MKTKGHIFHAFGDYLKCHSRDNICRNTAFAKVRTCTIATVYLFGLSVEESEKETMLCAGKVMNVTFIIFNKAYMRLEEKYSGDTTDQAAANTFIN